MEVKEEKSEVAENKQLEGNKRERYIWRIENFSSLDESHIYSGIFEVNGCRWRLMAFVQKVDGYPAYLGVGLDVPDSDTLPIGWRRMVEYSLHLINWMDSRRTLERDTTQIYNEGLSRSCMKFLLCELLDKKVGYLVNDTCMIEAEVCVTYSFPVFRRMSMSQNIDLDHLKAVYETTDFLHNWISEQLKQTISVSDSACAKEYFQDLVLFLFGDLTNPDCETAILESLCILSDNLSFFSDKEANESMELKDNFTTTIQEWRDSVQEKVSCERFFSTMEKTCNSLLDSVKRDEDLKNKLEELATRKAKLELQLELLESGRQRLLKERMEVAKQTEKLNADGFHQLR